MPDPKNYIVEPRLAGNTVTIGTEGGQTSVYIGRAGEVGGPRRVDFDATKEFVALIIGKRGSGKSFCLGSLLEGLCTTTESSPISRIATRRGVLLLDPMGNFWTSLIPVRGGGPPRVQEQWQMFDGWGVRVEDVDVDVVAWIPAGFRRDSDHPSIREFHVDVADLDAADWADILQTNLIRDPKGNLLAEAISAISEEGWIDVEGRRRQPKPRYTVQDIQDYLEAVRAEQATGHPIDHHVQTIRALQQRLQFVCKAAAVFWGSHTTDRLGPRRPSLNPYGSTQDRTRPSPRPDSASHS